MSNENSSWRCLKPVRETIHSLSSKLEESEVVQVLLDRVVSSLSVRGVLLLLLNQRSEGFLLRGAVGLSEGFLSRIPLSAEQSEVNQRILKGEAAVIADLAQVPELWDDGVAQEGLKSLIAVPLLIRGRLIGALHAYYPEILFDRQPLFMLETLADLGAMVLEKVRLHNGLYRIAEALNSSFDLKRMLKMLLSAAVTEMWLKGASIRLLDRKIGTLNILASQGLSETYSKKRGKLPLAKSGIDRRVMKGEVVIIHDIEEEKRFDHLEDALEEGIRSILAVPLILKGRIRGVMRAYSARPRDFGPVAVTFLRSVADLVSLAIESAELYAALERRCKDLQLDVADWHRFLTLG